MNIYSTTEGELTCPCGAAISEDDRHAQCRKCRARNRWERRAAGQRRHGRRDSQTSSRAHSSSFSPSSRTEDAR